MMAKHYKVIDRVVDNRQSDYVEHMTFYMTASGKFIVRVYVSKDNWWIKISRSEKQGNRDVVNLGIEDVVSLQAILSAAKRDKFNDLYEGVPNGN